jgi:hypothetical protein
MMKWKREFHFTEFKIFCFLLPTYKPQGHNVSVVLHDGKLSYSETAGALTKSCPVEFNQV